MQETILQTERIYSGRIVTLDVLDVRLPDGEAARREVIRHPGAAAIVALDGEGKLLLVRQYRIASDRIMLEIPAGTLDGDEAPEVCAARELQEETGYRPGKLEPFGGFFVAPGYTTEYIHLFLATGLTESRLDGDSDEFIQVERATLAEALAMIERGQIADGKSIIGILTLARRQSASART